MPIAVTNPLINCQSDKTRDAARISTAVQSMVRTLHLWGVRIRERQAFPVLDERDLRDLRISRWDIERELAKPFWRE